MTAEAQRIALVEACPSAIRNHHGRWQYSSDGGVRWWNCKDNDPLNDLNAIYVNCLFGMFDDGKGWDSSSTRLVFFPFICAPAAQRAKAFLRTIGMWVEDKVPA